jgi:DNA polymerase zeta
MKRYCGMKLESKSQRKPVFEAKGLETVRRDQCALTQKVLRNALIALFRHGKEAVKDYLYRQWSLIFSGQLPVSDFVLTGRVRSRYRGGREGPVQAVLARRIGEADPGRIIRHKERLPYVIVATPGITFRLKDCVLTPLELLERWDAYAVHSAYYIEKVRSSIMGSVVTFRLRVLTHDNVTSLKSARKCISAEMLRFGSSFH